MENDVKRRKPAEKRKTEYVRVRVTGEQKMLMTQASERAGITLSAWAVERLLRSARAELLEG